MLSVSSVTLAAILGSTYDTDVANINDCNVAPYSTGNCPQAVQYRKDGQDLSSMPSQMGVGMMPGNSQCGVN